MSDLEPRWWKYWIWLQEGSELANKKCFSHHYAQNVRLRLYFAFSSAQMRGGGEWKFIFVLEFPLGCFRVPAIYPTPLNILISFSMENTKNQKMIQMTSRKNESKQTNRKKLSLFILPMNLNGIAEWRRWRMEWDSKRIFNRKRWFSTDEGKWDINQSISGCRYLCISGFQPQEINWMKSEKNEKLLRGS